MDWQTPLKSQQAEFITRLRSGPTHLLCYDAENSFSELTVISGQRLKQLRDACWLLAERYKNTAPVHDVFINHLIGKLGESVIKKQLSNLVAKDSFREMTGQDSDQSFNVRQWKLFITYIRSYQYLSRFISGDLFPIGYLRLAANPSISLQIKASQGKKDDLHWYINKEEIEKNAVLICVWIQEEVNEAQLEYHLVICGFIPSGLLDPQAAETRLGLGDLLYAGGLRSFLEWISTTQAMLLPQPVEDWNGSSEAIASIKIGPWEYPLSSEQLRHLEIAIQTLTTSISTPNGKADIQALSISQPPPPFDLQQLWQRVLSHLTPPGTQALLRQHSRLLEFDGKKARIGISSNALFRVNQRWLPKIEEAFCKTCQQAIKVSLEVIAD